MKTKTLILMMCLSSFHLFSQNVMYIQDGAQLVCTDDAVITLQNIGSFINDGSFTAGNGNIIIKGSAITTIGGGSGDISFHKLTIDNQQGVQLAQSISVENAIRFITGNLNLENNTITLSPGAAIVDETETARIMDEPDNAGEVTITQPLGTSPHTNPGNVGVEINTTATAPGNTAITRFSGVVSRDGSSTGLIQRYYSIAPSVNSGLNASVKFHYLDAELNGVDPATAVLWKSTDNGTSWTPVIPDARDIGEKYLQKDLINDFSLWTIGTPNGVLPVNLISFEGNAAEGVTLLTWVTAGEKVNKGFDVQKSTDGINFISVGWIEGRGMTEQTSTYQFTDQQFTATSYYRLRQVDMDGQSTFSRIVVVTYPDRQNLTVVAYPNPAFNESIWVQLPDNTITVILFDTEGRTLRTWNKPAARHAVQLPGAGVYFLRVQTTRASQTIRLVHL